ncbi:2Fe-2S iron-sulfur cluster-binding protein [Candidatus Nitronereus thalassa]|uniref:2Fe-2S iron-sulfur cluster-binding protein n=1 Tax=Candidatus Nitronereus thalassa TaxID=3020898 RepID=A0ABU3K2X4_9BACT|nr:2Fe-2S iron-sulfur cluster-binding protein [Candidatus Nitronereus thalassa]MDT7040737.1 2Fe-2S iron-sulfur cluster-binding protein [Candidatus Nitronereus thalassa]
MTGGSLARSHRQCFLAVAAIVAWFLMLAGMGYAQISPEEHASHHPNQAMGSGGVASAQRQEGGPGNMVGGPSGGKDGSPGGMMGGGMDKMMEKMGAPKPKALYPTLMSLPDLPFEQRAEVQQQAHERMKQGTALMAEGMKSLSQSASTNDFLAMQVASRKLHEGLSQFESGLAAHRALAEGTSPRNVALQWFKQEMNLLPPNEGKQDHGILGLSWFHFSVMLLLVGFAVAMLFLYFFKMRRAAALLNRLAEDSGPVNSPPAAAPEKPAAAAGETPSSAGEDIPSNFQTTSARPPTSQEAKSQATASAECCDDSTEVCANEEAPSTDQPDISKGLLPVAKKKLCRLRVAQIYQETVDVKTFRLVACHGGGIPFSYLPGQFLTLTMPTGDKPIRRSYTMSSSPTQGYYCEITVKREEQGAGSRYLHDAVKVNDTLEVQAPSGKFVFAGKEADSIVLISGGVGITPMMSITRALTDMGWNGDIYFIAACRDPEHLIFQSELKRLQARHPNLHIFIAMSRLEKDVDSYHRGRIAKDLLAQWVPDIASKWIHLCGAPPMMEAVKQMLAELGVPGEKVHTENFGSQQKPQVRAAEREKIQKTTPVEKAGTVTFQKSDTSTELMPDETVLEASERVDVNIDYSCRTGSCGVCRVKLLSGSVTMEVEDGLDPDDKASGMILACQAKSTGNVAVDA